jgi:hypothetical protein
MGGENLPGGFSKHTLRHFTHARIRSIFLPICSPLQYMHAIAQFLSTSFPTFKYKLHDQKQSKNSPAPSPSSTPVRIVQVLSSGLVDQVAQVTK